MAKKRRGFSIAEILVTLAIIGGLTAVGAGSYGVVKQKGALAREVSAGRTLITAYHSSAAENNGRYLPGMDFSVNTVWFEPYKKNITMMHVANRYPFRLAPYFDYKLEGTILVNDNGRQIRNTMSGMYDYGVSAFPAFGINYWYVGGCVTSKGELQFPDECLTKVGQADKSLLVFASASSDDGSGGGVKGFNILTPPRMAYPSWVESPWKEKSNSGDYGNVDARYDGKAVSVFLDGSIRMLSIEELRDMRLWNRNAAAADAPSYSIPPQF